MMAAIVFEFPPGWQIGLPLAALLLAYAVWRQRGRGLRTHRMLCLAALRAVVLGLLVFLVARPMWHTKEPPAAASRAVTLLVDRS